MREIKFRGRCLDSGTWIYGSLFNSIWRKSADGSRVCYIFPDNMLSDDNGGGDCWEDFAEVAEQYEVDPATVGQYTGLKDKDGKEIYEGDIFNYTNEDGDDCISEVKYDDEDGCFNIADSSYIYGVNYAIKHMNANLIGDIHDNPELLKIE